MGQIANPQKPNVPNFSVMAKKFDRFGFSPSAAKG